MEYSKLVTLKNQRDTTYLPKDEIGADDVRDGFVCPDVLVKLYKDNAHSKS